CGAVPAACGERQEPPPLEDSRLLELGETRRECPRRNAFERLLELVEADGAGFGRRPEDRERPPPPEEIRRAGELLGERPALVTPHAGSASPSARGRARAPRR